MEYCGIDLHAEYSQICILDEDGEVMETSRVRSSRKALERFFRREPMRVVIEAGGSSPWVSRHLEALGHEVIVCSPRRVRLIAESKLKNDRVDAEVLARLVRLDPEFLQPILSVRRVLSGGTTYSKPAATAMPLQKIDIVPRWGNVAIMSGRLKSPGAKCKRKGARRAGKAVIL